MTGNDRAWEDQEGMDETINWAHWGRSFRRLGFLLRTFALAVGASLGAQALVGLWRWLRRPPGG